MYNLLRILLFFLIVLLNPLTSNYLKGQDMINENNIGVALYSFKDQDFQKQIDWSSDSLGIEFIEGFSFYKMGEDFSNKQFGDLNEDEITKVRNMLSKANLKMESCYFSGRNVEDWVKAFKAAKSFGLKYVVGEPKKQLLDTINQIAINNDIVLAIHNHEEGLSEYWHPDSALNAIKGLKNIKICADVGHWKRTGLDVVECLEKLAGRIAELHVKDISANGDDVNLGEGLIEWDKVKRELDRQGFKGKIYIECEHSFKNNLRDVKYNKDYLKNILK